MSDEVTYGCEIRHTQWGGTRTTYSVSGCKTVHEAIRQATALALLDGWTNPKWWQWWRRNDNRIPKEVIEDAARAV